MRKCTMIHKGVALVHVPQAGQAGRNFYSDVTLRLPHNTFPFFFSALYVRYNSQFTFFHLNVWTSGTKCF